MIKLLPAAAAWLGGCMLTAAAPVTAASCQFLSPVGGNGVTPIITKTIGAGNPLPFSRPNWNTDFFVTQPYSYFKYFFTATPSGSRRRCGDFGDGFGSQAATIAHPGPQRSDNP